jgi:hypothetical protein
LHYLFPLLRRDSRASIGDGQNRTSRAAVYRDPHLAALSSVLDRVVDQVRDGIEKQVPITTDRLRLARAKPQAYFLFFCCRVEEVDNLAGNLGKVYLAESSRPITVFDLRDPQQ